MSVHVAVLQTPYLRAILAGTKTVESRLTRNAGPPFGLVEPGERLYLKQSSGPFRAIALAQAVHSFPDLTPDYVSELRNRFEPRVGGDEAYWQSKADARYATMIELHHVEPCDLGPRYRVQHMKAWYALPDTADPIREVTLTAGAARNAVVKLPRDAGASWDHPVKLELPDGRTVETDVYRGQRFRWRGWRRYFEAHGVTAGHRVRLTALGRRRYRVSFPDATTAP